MTNSSKLILLYFLAITLASCESRLEKKQREGFQIFQEYGIAIKTPHELVFDSTVTYPADLGTMKAYVYPQIFTDTSRTSFKLHESLLAGEPIYHLRIWENKEPKDIAVAINEQMKIMYEFDIDSIEDVIVDGKSALLYGPLKTYTWEAYIPTENNAIYVGITDENGKEELEKVLGTLIIEE